MPLEASSRESLPLVAPTSSTRGKSTSRRTPVGASLLDVSDYVPIETHRQLAEKHRKLEDETKALKGTVASLQAKLKNADGLHTLEQTLGMMVEVTEHHRLGDSDAALMQQKQVHTLSNLPSVERALEASQAAEEFIDTHTPQSAHNGESGDLLNVARSQTCVVWDAIGKHLTCKSPNPKSQQKQQQVSAQQQKQPAEDEVSSTCTVLHCACSDADCADGS